MNSRRLWAFREAERMLVAAGKPGLGAIPVILEREKRRLGAKFTTVSDDSGRLWPGARRR